MVGHAIHGASLGRLGQNPARAVDQVCPLPARISRHRVSAEVHRVSGPGPRLARPVAFRVVVSSLGRREQLILIIAVKVTSQSPLRRTPPCVRRPSSATTTPRQSSYAMKRRPFQHLSYPPSPQSEMRLGDMWALVCDEAGEKGYVGEKRDADSGESGEG